MEVTLEKIPEPKILEDRIEGDIAYLRLPVLDTPTVNRLRDKLTQLQSNGAHKLMLDLRDCAIGEPCRRRCCRAAFPALRNNCFSQGADGRRANFSGGCFKELYGRSRWHS